MKLLKTEKGGVQVNFNREKNIKANCTKNLKLEWKSLPIKIKHLWIERYKGEKQIKHFISSDNGTNIINWEDINPVNCYAEFLVEKLKAISHLNQLNSSKFNEYFDEYVNDSMVAKQFDPKKVSNIMQSPSPIIQPPFIKMKSEIMKQNKSSIPNKRKITKHI